MVRFNRTNFKKVGGELCHVAMQNSAAPLNQKLHPWGATF